MADAPPRPWSPTEERVGNVAVRLMSVLNVWIFRASGGRLGSRFFLHGSPVCLLTTTGAKTGRRRTTPLIYLADGENVVLVASKGGMSHHPAWYHNLMKHPEAEVQIGGETRRLTARRASAEEKRALWPHLNEVYPEYASYQARTERDIPVMILSPRT